MIEGAPGFWVRYRGISDPQIPNNTTYTYTIGMTAPKGVVLLNATVTILGPSQLTKQNYMDVRWSYTPGLVQVSIAKNSVAFYRTNGAEQGFRDEGQYSAINGGVTNQ